MKKLGRKIECRKILLAVIEMTSNEAVGLLANTMLLSSLPASGTSRNQNTAADRDATIGRLPA